MTPHLSGPLQMVQSSTFHAFRYDFFNADDERVGGFEFAAFAQATNARLKLHPEGSTAGDIHLAFGQPYRVAFEYLSRGWVNDIRYRLVQDGGAVLASLDIEFVEGERLPQIRLRLPVEGRLERSGSFIRRVFTLHAEPGGAPLVTVSENRAWQVKRAFDIVGDALPPHVNAFVGVVVTCLRF
jgi:hypothetical protein